MNISQPGKRISTYACSVMIVSVIKEFESKNLMHKFVLSLVLTFLSLNLFGQSHGRLKVSADKFYLQYEDGTPFFWLGDTGWELFNRLTLKEIKTYLDNRAAKGFNVIQVTALSAVDIKRPNRYGDIAFDSDPLKPNEKYFSLIDSVLRYALERQIFIALVATWGDKVVPSPGSGTGPILIGKHNAYAYGKWIGNRFKNFPNIIWVTGGDVLAVKDTSDYRPVWTQMANGIIEATNHQCLITYHPSGSRSSSQWLHAEPWMDFNMIQSSHGRRDAPNWDMIRKDRLLKPSKPVVDSEPNYEDHPVNPWPTWKSDSGYFRAYDVRKQMYRSVFAGGFGVTYGHHALWQFMSEREEVVNYADRGWLDAMDRPGAYQAGFLRKLIESRPMQQRIPDASIIAAGQGSGKEHMEAFRGVANDYAMIYLPIGKNITINTSFMKCKNIVAWWFNPKDATVQKIGSFPRTANMQFTPPATGIENDWVLVIDDADKKFKEPGKYGN